MKQSRIGLGKGRGGEGEWTWAHPMDDEPWGSGWSTSGILYAFVSHLGGYGYFPFLSRHRVILGPSLPAHTQPQITPVSKLILAKAGNTTAVLEPTSSPSLQFWDPG